MGKDVLSAHLQLLVPMFSTKGQLWTSLVNSWGAGLASSGLAHIPPCQKGASTSSCFNTVGLSDEDILTYFYFTFLGIKILLLTLTDASCEVLDHQSLMLQPWYHKRGPDTSKELFSNLLM